MKTFKTILHDWTVKHMWSCCHLGSMPFKYWKNNEIYIVFETKYLCGESFQNQILITRKRQIAGGIRLNNQNSCQLATVVCYCKLKMLKNQLKILENQCILDVLTIWIFWECS